jgi:hypothetical protein
VNQLQTVLLFLSLLNLCPQSWYGAPPRLLCAECRGADIFCVPDIHRFQHRATLQHRLHASTCNDSITLDPAVRFLNIRYSAVFLVLRYFRPVSQPSREQPCKLQLSQAELRTH